MADGMGGYRSGEVASALAVQTIVRHVRLFQHQETGHISRESIGMSPASRLLLDAIDSADTAVFQIGRREADCEGMATTVIAAWFIGDRIAVGHVGDSRLYRVRGASIEQITTDHSLVQELIELGVCTPEEAQKSAPKNLG
jgi:PPM family protein phosphatase